MPSGFTQTRSHGGLRRMVLHGNEFCLTQRLQSCFPRYYWRNPSSMTRKLWLLVCIVACRTEPSRSTGSVDVARDTTRPAGGDSLSADDGQWLRPSKDYASTRFSGLSEINTT